MRKQFLSPNAMPCLQRSDTEISTPPMLGRLACWQICIVCRAATPRPSRSTSARWPSARRRWAPTTPMSAQSLNNLAVLYQAQGRYAEAEPLYKRALAIREKALGPDHPDVGTLAQQPGRAVPEPRAATPRPSRSTSARSRSARRRWAPTTPMSAPSLNNLAELYRAQGRYAEAEPLYQARARHPREGAGPRPPRCRHSAQQPGRAVSTPRAATPRPSRSTSARSRSARRRWGPTTPMSAQSLNNLAALYFVQRDWARAADFWRRSTGVIVRRAERGTTTSAKP